MKDKEPPMDKKKSSSGWFRSIDLWVMGPARFHCATLLLPSIRESLVWESSRAVAFHGLTRKKKEKKKRPIRDLNP